MPSLDTIRNLTIRATQQGVTETTAALNNLAGAQARVSSSAGTMATVTDMSSKRQLSAAQALSRLAAAHDKTYRAEQQHARGTALLERATAQGLSGTKEFAIAQAALNKLHHEAAGAVSLSSTQIAESIHVVKALGDEFASSGLSLRAFLMEGGRIGQIFTEGSGGVGGTMKAFAGILGRAATGWVGLTVATTAAVGISAAAALAYEASQERMQRAVEGTGRAAGITAGQLGALAEAGARSGNLGLGEARGIAAGYTQAGLQPGMTAGLLADTSRYARFTDQDNGEAGKQLAAAFKDPVRGAGELDHSLGFLNDRLSQTIHDYEASGQHAAAQNALMEAFNAALKNTTDSTWALGDAYREAKRWGGSVIDKVGAGVNHLLGGDLSTQDKLDFYRQKLPDTYDSPLALGTSSRSYVQDQIKRLEAELATRSDPAAAARDTETDRLSGLVGPLVRGILPEITRATDATNNLTLLRQALSDPGVVAKLGGGIDRSQVETAFQRTAVVSANADPMRRMMQDYELARASADAFSVAEHAAVDARRAELAVLRETGDVSRAATAAEIARNEVIDKANNDAKDRLGVAQDQASLVGLLPGQRALEELRLKYEGYGGQYAKDAAGRSDLDDAMKPVARDLHDAGETIAKAMRDSIPDRITAAGDRLVTAIEGVAAKVAGGSPYGTLTPIRPNDAVGPFSPAPFAGKVGAVSDNERQLVDMLMKAGYTNRAADAGFVGGVAGESTMGLDPMSRNASGHRGIAQWEPSRFAGASAYGDPNSFAAQAQLLIHELQTSESAAGAALRSATTIQGGLAANLRFERPRQDEVASSYNKRLAAGTALGADMAGLTPPGIAMGPLTIHPGDSNNNRAGSPSPVAGVVPSVSTSLGTDHQIYGTERDALLKQQQLGPIQDATLALDAQRAALAASISTFGQSAAAVAAAAEKQKLLTEYTRAGIEPTADTRAGIDLLAQSYGELAKAQAEAQQRQHDLIGVMDDVRGSAKGFLDPLIQAGLHGTSVLAALHSGLESVASKLAGKLEDTAIDSLFGKSGSASGGIFGGALSGLFGGSAGAASSASSFFPGFAAGGYTGHGQRYEAAGVVHRGEYVVQASAVSQNLPVLHAINTTGRLPGFADGGMVGSSMSAANGNDGSGGDTHYHIDARGSTLTHGEMQSALTGAIAANNARLPGMLADRQRRTGLR